MTFKIDWHPQAFKNLKRLQKQIIEQVLKKLDAVALEPFRYLEHYEGENFYKLRIGDYRALVDIDTKENTILIQQFDHRKRVYKN